MQMTLSQLRTRIDQIDKIIIKALSQRTKIVKEIAKIKKQQHLPIINKSREQEIYQKLKQQAKKYHLDEKYLHKIFTTIIQHSKKVQNKI